MSKSKSVEKKTTKSEKGKTMSKINWENELNANGYYCTKQLADSVHVSLGTKPVGGAFLFGPAGTGKSFLPEKVAEVMEANYFFYQCFPGTREDDLMIKLLPNEDTISGIKAHDGIVKQALESSHDESKPTILVLDEWDKTRPSADSFLLDFLQSGRVKFNGFSGVANIDNLYVFITMNDERDLSEPLLRRLPKIDFKPLPLKLVAKALKASHPKSSYIEPALVLYQKCVRARMPKPCTIQELRQLLDAIDALGGNCNWDDLVYQFITKTVENHNKLAQVLEYDGEDDYTEEEKKILNAEKFNADQIKDADIKVEISASGMPKLSDFFGIDPSFLYAEEVDKKNTYGIITHTDENYSAVVTAINELPHENPAYIGEGELAVCEGGYISFKKPISLTDLHLVDEIWGKDGEISFQEKNATMDEVRSLCSRGMKIVKYSKKEIVAKAEKGNIDMRWTPEAGAEIIVGLMDYPMFRTVFGGIGEENPQAWISEPEGFQTADNPSEFIQVSNPDSFGVMYKKRYGAEIEISEEKKLETLMDSFCAFDYEWDYWTDAEVDSINTEDIPLWDEFLRESGLKHHMENGYRYFNFRNISFRFEEDNNDTFGLKITGKFKSGLVKYIKAWVPKGDLTFSMITTLGWEYFVSNYKFENTEDEASVYGEVSGIPMVVRKGSNRLYASLPNDDSWDYKDVSLVIHWMRELYKRCAKNELA